MSRRYWILEGETEQVKKILMTVFCCIFAAYILTFLACLKMRYEDKLLD